MTINHGIHHSSHLPLLGVIATSYSSPPILIVVVVVVVVVVGGGGVLQFQSWSGLF